jgi:hypothetical protein
MRMKTGKILLLLVGLLVSGSALAWHHGGVRFGFYVGVPVGPYWYPPYYPYYYPPAVVTVPSSPPVYVEQGAAAPAAPVQQNYWYYCAESKSYYPYVKECPGGWQRVTPQPQN